MDFTWRSPTVYTGWPFRSRRKGAGGESGAASAPVLLSVLVVSGTRTPLGRLCRWDSPPALVVKGEMQLVAKGFLEGEGEPRGATGVGRSSSKVSTPDTGRKRGDASTWASSNPGREGPHQPEEVQSRHPSPPRGKDQGRSLERPFGESPSVEGRDSASR